MAKKPINGDAFVRNVDAGFVVGKGWSEIGVLLDDACFSKGWADAVKRTAQLHH